MRRITINSRFILSSSCGWFIFFWLLECGVFSFSQPAGGVAASWTGAQLCRRLSVSLVSMSWQVGDGWQHILWVHRRPRWHQDVGMNPQRRCVGAASQVRCGWMQGGEGAARCCQAALTPRTRQVKSRLGRCWSSLHFISSAWKEESIKLKVLHL